MACKREDLLLEISQRLQAMRTQEKEHYAVPDYLTAEWQWKLRQAAKERDDEEDDDSAPPTMPHVVSPSSSSASLADIDSRSLTSVSRSSHPSQMNKLWREKICEWCYQIADTYNFSREIVAVAMSYLDRYLATRVVNCRSFQLAAMTALYLAVKLYEPAKLRVSSLIHLSRGFFTAEHVVIMERSMLQALEWHVHPPTSVAFCRDLMHIVSGDIGQDTLHDINELARFMTELSVCDYWFATKMPSSVALAAIVNAIDLQGPRRVDPKHKVEFLQWVVDIGMDIVNDEEIFECYGRLRQMYIATGYSLHLGEAAAVVTATAKGSADIGNQNQSQEFVEQVASTPWWLCDFDCACP